MSTKDVDVLIRDARKAGLHVELNNGKWHVTSDKSEAQAFIPSRATGRGLANARSAIRRLTDAPAPMVAAVNPHNSEEGAMGWPIEDLLTHAVRQGVRVEVRGGLLHVSGPVDAEPFARLLRDREADVLDHLAPSTESCAPMPRVGDVARIELPSPVVDVAADARAVWEIIRGLARTQGDKRAENAGRPGVYWRGALTRVMRETRPDWEDLHRKDVSLYLERSGHLKCQSRNANPPVWWVLPEWDNGGLTVTKATPKPAKPKTAGTNGVKPAAPGELPTMGDPLAMLQAVAQRVTDAELRASDAEELLNEALAENEQLRIERDQYKQQVEEIGNAFRVLAGGTK